LEPIASKPRIDVSYLASMIGGMLVVVDYLTIVLVIPGLTASDFVYIGIGMGLGLAMILGAYLYRRVKLKRWVYLLLLSSILSLFLYGSILSIVGAFLGSMAAMLQLTRSRMPAQPTSV